VISAVVDTDGIEDEASPDTWPAAPACMVHITWAPCPHNGEPACPVPLHAYLGGGTDRDGALRMWRIRTHRQRPLILHTEAAGRTPEDHITEEDMTPCWCGAEVLPAEEAA
jgi:hypothetical protein